MNRDGRFDNRQRLGAQQQPKILQPKVAGGLAAARPAQVRPHPIAPPVYRPQPLPQVLQAKMHCHQAACQPNRSPVAPPAYRPQPIPKVLQQKTAVSQPPGAGQAPRQPVAPPVYRPEQKKIAQLKPNALAQPRKMTGAVMNNQRLIPSTPIQRQITILGGRNQGVHTTKGGKSTKELINELEKDVRSDNWKRGWKLWVQLKAAKSANEDYADVNALANAVDAAFQQAPKSSVTRPSFPSTTYTLAKAVHAVNTGNLDPNLSLADEDLAVPHRFSYADIRNNVKLFVDGKEPDTDLVRWTDREIEATKKRKRLSEGSANSNLLPQDYGKKVDKQVDELIKKRQKLVDAKKLGTVKYEDALAQDLISALNASHGNVPDLGPHSTVNIPVSNRGHMNIKNDGSMSPGTESLVCMSPHRLEKGIATTFDGSHIVTTYGEAVPILKLPQHVIDKLNKHKLSKTTLDQSKM